MKWYFLNAGQRLRFAVHNPGYAFKAVLREITRADERFLATLSGTRPTKIRQFLQEPSLNPAFLSHLRDCEGVFRQGMASVDLWGKKVLVQYAAARVLQPDVVVETGVASGVSSAYLLVALEQNQKGKLHSIEIGDPAYLPTDKQPVWIVPEWLRPRRRLHIGDVRAVLPGLLAEVRKVDLFIHDTLHTYEQMKFEFELAHP